MKVAKTYSLGCIHHGHLLVEAVMTHGGHDHAFRQQYAPPTSIPSRRASGGVTRNARHGVAHQGLTTTVTRETHLNKTFQQELRAVYGPRSLQLVVAVGIPSKALNLQIVLAKCPGGVHPRARDVDGLVKAEEGSDKLLCGTLPPLHDRCVHGSVERTASGEL